LEVILGIAKNGELRIENGKLGVKKNNNRFFGIKRENFIICSIFMVYEKRRINV